MMICETTQPKTLLLEKAQNSQYKHVYEQIVWFQGKLNNMSAWLENETDYYKIIVKVTVIKSLDVFRKFMFILKEDTPFFLYFGT